MIHKNLAAETLIPHSRAQGMTNYTVCGARELNCMGKVCVTPNNLSRNINGHVPNNESTSHRPNLFKVISPLTFFFFLEGLFLLKRNEFP